MAFKIKIFDKKYRKLVEELAFYNCISMLEEDFNHMFVVLSEDETEFLGFGFLRINGDYAELNGPFLKKFVKEDDYKALMERVLKGIRKYYPGIPIYFFTDYPEHFEKLCCEVSFDAPPEVLLKAVPG